MTDQSDNSIEFCIRDLFDSAQSMVSPSPDGLGLKAHIEELFNGNEDEDGNVGRVFIQLYAESVLSIKPADIGLGFTDDDVISHDGIIIANVESRTDPPSYFGETMAEDEFIEEFSISDVMARRIKVEVVRLRNMAKPQESFLEQASTLYNDRIPGNKGVVDERVIC